MMMNLNLTPHQQQRLILGTGIALSLLVAITFFSNIWQWYDDWALVHAEVKNPSVLASIEDSAKLVSSIPDEHLFGQASEDVPISSLQLRVTGIVSVQTEQNGSYSKAYISIAGQPSKIYKAGDSLPYGVTVHEITPDTVILENDGRLEKLPMPREKLQFKPRNTQEEHF